MLPAEGDPAETRVVSGDPVPGTEDTGDHGSTDSGPGLVGHHGGGLVPEPHQLRDADQASPPAADPEPVNRPATRSTEA